MTTSKAAAAPGNPLDFIQEVSLANNWHVERATDDELILDLPGRKNLVKCYFVWHEEMGALLLSSVIEMSISVMRLPALYALLSMINERLWLGHFDCQPEDNIILYRYTLLLRGTLSITFEQIEDIIETAMNECERFSPAFHYVLLEKKSPEEALDLTSLDPIGEA